MMVNLTHACMSAPKSVMNITSCVTCQEEHSVGLRGARLLIIPHGQRPESPAKRRKATVFTRMLRANRTRPDKDMRQSMTHALPNTFWLDSATVFPGTSAQLFSHRV